MNFIDRFRQYIESMIRTLIEEEGASSVFANTTDIGQSKEAKIRDLLRLHIPKSANVDLGGFLFDLDGNESKQLDLLITDSSSLRYDFHNRDGGGKVFACVDGCVGVISSKTTLNKNEISEALENIASIPSNTALDARNSDQRIDLSAMNDGPVKAIISQSGIDPQLLIKYVGEFYQKHPEIPISRRPNYIHVLGRYCWVGIRKELKNDDGTMAQPGQYCLRMKDPDLYFFCELLLYIEKLTRMHRAIWYDYTKIFSQL
ncbi:MAG: hypothetical protein KKD92_10245 [Proteobacteria bacterium]|nr:hypothetical protein [Pseudomonadota bacterium]